MTNRFEIPSTARRQFLKQIAAFVAAPEAITSMLSTGHIVPEEVEVASYLVSTIVGLHGAWMEDP